MYPTDNPMDLEEEGLDLGSYLAILKRRKWQLILPILLFAPIAVLVAMELPPIYRSAATVLIEQQEIPPELIRTTVTGFADQRIQVIKQRVMTLENLSRLIEQYGLYPEIREKKSINAAVDEMRKDVGLNMVSASVVDPRSGGAKQATIAFRLSFKYGSAAVTQKVTNELVSLFMAENLRQREAAVEEASNFLREEADKLADRIRGLEGALAKFKQEHPNNLPELFSLNRELMQRAEEQLRENARTIRSLEEQQLLLETQLSQINPELSTVLSQAGESAMSPAMRLRTLETEYVGIASRYGPTHPDRINIEREISALRKLVGEADLSALRRQREEIARQLEVARERYAPQHPDVQRLERDLAQADRRLAGAGTGSSSEVIAESTLNPAYVQLKARLDGIKLEIQALRDNREGLQARIEIYEQRLLEAPNIEREYNDLTRGYDNAVTKYREVKDKQLEAELAEALEAGRKAERFTLIEPPIVPSQPIEPNRPAILMLGMLGSVGAGVGHLALREFLDKGLYGARTVQMLTGTPPMAVIPYIGVAAERRRRVWRRYLIAGGVLLSLVLAAAAVHLFVKPLDLIWFMLLRKLEAYLPIANALQDWGLMPWIA